MTDSRQLDLIAWAESRPTAKIIFAERRWQQRDQECIWQACYTPHPNLNADVVDIADRRKTA